MVSPSYLTTRAWWRGSLERSTRAFAAAMLATLGVPQAADGIGFDVRHIGWLDAMSIGAGAAVVSLLFSIVVGASGVGPSGSPSLVDDRPSLAELADGERQLKDEQAGKHRDDGLGVVEDR